MTRPPRSLTSKETHHLLSKIRILDDFLPDYDYAKFKKDYNFDKIESNYTQDNNYLTIQFSDIGARLLEQSNIKLPTMGYGKVKTVVTELAHITDVNTNFDQTRHTDDTQEFDMGYTLSYNWMGQNNAGGLSFYNTFFHKVPLINVPFRQNRLVVFPARIPHQGYANTGNYECNSKRVVYTLFTVLEGFT